jgi:hypothetical protein
MRNSLEHRETAMNQEQPLTSDQAFILAYLYDELSSQRRLDFEQRLQTDPLFCSLYHQQLELEAVMKPGTQPIIDDKRMDAVHWSLQKQLRKQVTKQRSLFGMLANLWQTQVSFKAQFASMIATFTLGLLLAQGGLFSNDAEDSGSERLVAAQDFDSQGAETQSDVPMSLIKDNDFQITDLQLKKFDPSSDKVQLVYSLESRTRVDGNIANGEIQQLLASSLKDDVSDATRLDLIEVLKNYAEFEQVRDALSHSLLNDPNPGVRMVAAESLSKLSADKSVRRVLLNALQNDVNPGVRVEVFQALLGYLSEQSKPDQDTLEVLQNYSVRDSNQYIRQQSKSLLNQNSRQKETQI